MFFIGKHHHLSPSSPSVIYWYLGAFQACSCLSAHLKFPQFHKGSAIPQLEQMKENGS
jgi:hypothetical protein